MPVVNIVDYRDQPHDTLAAIVVEPSFLDNGVKGATQHQQGKIDRGVFRELGPMHIAEALALLRDEPVEVTLYLYTPVDASYDGGHRRLARLRDNGGALASHRLWHRHL